MLRVSFGAKRTSLSTLLASVISTPAQNSAKPPPTHSVAVTPASPRSGIAGTSHLASSAAASARISAGRSARAAARQSADAQRNIGPNGIRQTTGSISSTNMKPKYGGPTEMRPTPSASPISGYNVPSSTIAAAQANSRLLISSSVSRDSSLNGLPPATFGARNA